MLAVLVYQRAARFLCPKIWFKHNEFRYISPYFPSIHWKKPDFPINTSDLQGMFQLVIFDYRRVIRWNWLFLAVSGELFSSISDPIAVPRLWRLYGRWKLMPKKWSRSRWNMVKLLEMFQRFPGWLTIQSSSFRDQRDQAMEAIEPWPFSQVFVRNQDNHGRKTWKNNLSFSHFSSEEQGNLI